ncbi:MAG: peptidoglycan DD-metalloendopeptidase family protein [Gammaproteobacteria bacterium]|nr:peptidoglycan DD-metalloendopeptidase family protein [Gammaproteobacteria bacterium]
MITSSTFCRFSRCTYHCYLQIFTGFGLISVFLISQLLYAEDLKEKSAQLDSVRGKIEDVKTSMEKARLETKTLQEELKKNETSAGSIALNIREIEKQLRLRNKRLDVLKSKKSSHEKVLTEQKSALAQQIRSAYMVGKNDYIKLLLNQEDPARVGRVLAYYDYHNQTRAQQIHSVNTEIEALTQLENNINRENDALLKLKQSQLTKNKEIDKSRKERNVILSKLLNQLEEQGLELQALQQQEQETKILLEKLSEKQARENLGITAVFEDIPPFSSLKGKLDWPVEGKLVTRFGSYKRGEKLKWHGVIIDAKIGVEVQAVSGGQVVFADWFRNLGLLIIIDHGDSYMSLYGYNQSLLKNTGDWVLPGEVIALAGDSGGQLRSGVYFEIRNNGSPVNPAKWCRN